MDPHIRPAVSRWWVPGVLVALVVLAAGIWIVAFRGGDAAVGTSSGSSFTVTEIPPAERGDPMELAGDTLTGESLSLKDYRGGVVVVNVWGSWCGPCIAEAPVLAAASADYAPRGVRFVGINVQDNVAAARAFERVRGITYPSIDDNAIGGVALLAFRNTIPPRAIPSTLILDRQGRVAARVIGQVADSTLRGLIDQVLTEAATP